MCVIVSIYKCFLITVLETDEKNSSEYQEYPDYSEYVCTTIRGPRPNKPCVFPFTFNGERKSTCIKGRRRPEPWCSTKVDNGNNYIRGEWGYCGDCLDLGMKIIFDYVLIKVVI